MLSDTKAKIHSSGHLLRLIVLVLKVGHITRFVQLQCDLKLLRLLTTVRTEVAAISQDLALLVEVMDRTFDPTATLRDLPTLSKCTLQ